VRATAGLEVLDRRVFLLQGIEPLFIRMHSNGKNSKFVMKIFTQTYLFFGGGWG
jgi:hypothetical protein